MDIKKQDRFIHYSNILGALAHPARLRIAMGLMDCGCNVSKIVRELGLPQSTVSQHLGVLRRAGILIPHRKGVEICYSVGDPKMKRLIRLLAEK
jgi:DNA-binding transcriptional ArsR family regulator